MHSTWTRSSGYQDQYRLAKLSQDSKLILVWCTHQDDLGPELEGLWSSLKLWEDSEVASESESVVVGQLQLEPQEEGHMLNIQMDLAMSLGLWRWSDNKYCHKRDPSLEHSQVIG